MTIASMTGFARATETAAGARFAWELKSVNGKSLDIRVRTPPGFDDLAEEARKRIGAVLKRGTCFVALTAQRDERPPAVTINERLLSQLVELSARFNGQGLAPPSLDGLLAVRGVVEIVEAREDEAVEAALRAAMTASLDRAIAALVETRRSEGAVLRTILDARLAGVGRLADDAEAHPARQPDAIRKRLAEQIATLVGGGRELDSNRLHQEAVLMATRADIREELDRLKAHVVAARSLIEEGGAVGRRLDFLAQEMAREANTLSAKANDVSLNAIGLDLKTIVEQFREQVQNVE